MGFLRCGGDPARARRWEALETWRLFLAGVCGLGVGNSNSAEIKWLRGRDELRGPTAPFFLMKTLGVKGKLLCQGPLPLGFICGSKLPRSGTGVKLGRSRTWRETPISNYPPVILRFSPLKSPPPAQRFLSQTRFLSREKLC